MYDARQIANWFVEKGQQSGQRFSIMELLKLVYISHGWHLEVFDKPLFSNRIEAWKFGPVIPDVYNAFRHQGVYVSNKVAMNETPLSAADEGLLNEVFDIYGKMPAFKLSNITHETGGPWDVIQRTQGLFSKIGDDLIKAHYEQKRMRTKATA